MLFVGGEKFIYFWKPSIKDLLLAIIPESMELSPTLPNTSTSDF